MKKKYYLPTPQNPTSHCVGEAYFFEKIRHWKLAVMAGYSWNSISVTQAGFSFMPLKEHIDKFSSLLEELGIEYKKHLSPSGWSVAYYISKKKANLQKIDSLYEKYYVVKMEQIKKECVAYDGHNYVNQEQLEFIKNKLGCSINHYEPIN